ncbi:MAG: hypothetical protein OEM59_05500 [Rhodospirillales bacterium]|nr:hypothetical protein [Rhodospirillales bacterium]
MLPLRLAPFLAPLVALGTVALLAQPREAAAFCVANQAEQAFTFEVDTDGSEGRNAPYVRRLGPKESFCCDWQSYACNATKQADAVLWFSARTEVGMMEWQCLHEFYASDNVTLYAHDGASGCRWGRRDGFAGEAPGLWSRLGQWLGTWWSG